MKLFRYFTNIPRLLLLLATVSTLILLTRFLQYLSGGILKDRDYVNRNNPDIDLRQNSNCTACKSGIPCQYNDVVDFRIIILAFNRAESLKKCLEKVNKLQLDGANVAVEIWMDIRTDGRFHLPTYLVGKLFSTSWSKGRVCIHIQTEHAYVAKQWLYSWRPRENSPEIGLIIEDDIDISPHAFRWLKAANKTFSKDNTVFGYSLQMENVFAQSNPEDIPIFAPPSQNAYKMTIFGTWGFSPKGNFWRNFQDWHALILAADPLYKPYVKGYRSSGWYQMFEKKNDQESMAHEMWLIHYVAGHRDKLYCLYSNLLKYTDKENVMLSSHRRENGLHYKNVAKREDETSSKLLTVWQDDYGRFDENVPSYDAFGNLVPNW